MLSYRSPLSASGSYPCTQYLDEAALDTPEQSSTGTEDLQFRVDTALVEPTATGQQQGAKALTVSVCWTDDQGRVQQVQTTRLLLPEA